MMSLPLLPHSCQTSGRLKPRIDKGFEGVARVAITFNKVEINKIYIKSFMKTSGMSGKFLYIGERLIKFLSLLDPSEQMKTKLTEPQACHYKV